MLEEALRDGCAMPAATTQQLAAQLDAASGGGNVMLVYDGIRRNIPRPVDDEKQKETYGKKKKHTLKNGLIVSAMCLIVFAKATVSGTVHDKKVAE